MAFQVFVDADACPRPCLKILKRYQKEMGYMLITVASFNHNLDNEHHIIVGNEKDAADLAIVNRLSPGDLVVTQDWGLAALVLGKRAHALSPIGKVYSIDTMDFLLEERSMKAKFRKAGGRTRGPAARTNEDDQRFEKALLRLLTRLR